MARRNHLQLVDTLARLPSSTMKNLAYLNSRANEVIWQTYIAITYIRVRHIKVHDA